MTGGLPAFGSQAGAILSSTSAANYWRSDDFPVPEPASLSLLAAGLIVAGRTLRRRARS